MRGCMSTFALENEDLCQALRRRVKHYKREHPMLSSQQIAKKFKMSSSTLNRIENQDIKNPTIDQVLKVLRGTGETDDLLSFIEEYYPDIADTYREVYSENLDRTFVDNNHEKFFKDPRTFTVMLMAFTGEGTTESEIKETLGSEGLKVLRELFQKEILSINNGKISKSSGKDYAMSIDASKDLLINSIKKFYNSDHFGTGYNFLSLQTSQVDREKVMPEVNKVLKKAFSEIHEMLNAEENQGSDKVFIGLTADTFFNSRGNI